MSETLKCQVSVGPFRRRDRFAAWLASQALRMASPRYRAIVKGATALGLKTAAMGEVWVCEHREAHDAS